MTKTIRLLALLLGAQLLLAAGLHFTGPDLAATANQTPILAFDRDLVDRVLIEGTDQTQTTLARREGTWSLPDLENFPADATRVAQLLARLAELQGGLPVATSAAAQPRFRVGDADFERRVTLFAGEEKLATLYLGSSPGMGQIHARADGSDRIAVVELAAFDIPVPADDWIDRMLVQIPSAEIQAIASGDLRLERIPAPEADAATDAAKATDQPPAPHWQATGLAAGEQLDQEAADALAAKFAELSIGAVLGSTLKPEFGLDAPALSIAVTRRDGDTRTLTIGKNSDGENYTLKASNRPEYFRLPSYTAEQLLQAAAREVLIGANGVGHTPAVVPEAVVPEAVAPEAVAPEAVAPDASTSEAGTPEPEAEEAGTPAP